MALRLSDPSLSMLCEALARRIRELEDISRTVCTPTVAATIEKHRKLLARVSRELSRPATPAQSTLLRQLAEGPMLDTFKDKRVTRAMARRGWLRACDDNRAYVEITYAGRDEIERAKYRGQP